MIEKTFWIVVDAIYGKIEHYLLRGVVWAASSVLVNLRTYACSQKCIHVCFAVHWVGK